MLLPRRFTTRLLCFPVMVSVLAACGASPASSPGGDAPPAPSGSPPPREAGLAVPSSRPTSTPPLSADPASLRYDKPSAKHLVELRRAVDKTEKAGPVRLQYSVSLGNQTYRGLAGVGQVDFAADTARFVPEPLAPSLSSEIVHVDGEYNLKYRQQPDDELPDDRPWLRLSVGDALGTLAPGQGANLAGVWLIEVAPADPRQWFLAVREYAAEASLARDETERQPGEHYRVQLEQNMPASARNLLLTLHPRTVLDVWVHEERIRRITAAGPDGKVTIELAEPGPAAAVAAPAQDLTITPEQLDQYETSDNAE